MKIHILLIISLVLFLGSCVKELGFVESSTTVFVEIQMPDPDENLKIFDRNICFRNINSGITYNFSEEKNIDLLPGIYDISFRAIAKNEDGLEISLRASSPSTEISGDNIRITMSAYRNLQSSDLIISEIFFSGTLLPSGNTYYGDDYIKLYNNTDKIIYADGITIFESRFLTTRKYDYTPDIMSREVTVQALYTIPGSGTDYPVLPGEFLLIADTAIDHRITNPYSFDLSHSDFEWYDQSSHPSSLDIDGLAPNLDKWYCYTQSFWMLHNRGFKAFGIARIPIDKETYLRDYNYTYEYNEVTNAGTFPMSQRAYRLPNDWVGDIVVCSVESEYAWQVCAPALDCGWTGCGTIDNDKSRFFHSVRRKLVGFETDGRPILKDTNNSSEDFNRMCTPSEIEIQHSVADMQGNHASEITYDGIAK